MKKIIAFALAGVLLLLSGCGLSSAVSHKTDSPAASATGSVSRPGIVPGNAEASAHTSPSAQASVKPSAQTSPSPSAAAVKTDLTQQELSNFTAYLNDQSNYGFLLSTYTKPAEIDLNEVLYTGAGLWGQSSSISQQEEKDYLAYVKMDELWGDLMKLSTKQLDTFLLEKTGLKLSGFTGSFKWVYFKQYDAYFRQVSDTNYSQFRCVSGTKQGDTYVIMCQQASEYGQRVDKCQVTLKKNGGKYLFYANNAHMTY